MHKCACTALTVSGQEQAKRAALKAAIGDLPRRLAACAGPAEALEVLDEVVLEESPGTTVRDVNRGLLMDSRIHACEENGCPRVGSLHKDGKHDADLAAAFASLLRETHSQEKELRERQEKREQRIAELREQHRRERKRAVKKLLRQVAPPPEKFRSTSWSHSLLTHGQSKAIRKYSRDTSFA